MIIDTDKIGPYISSGVQLVVNWLIAAIKWLGSGLKTPALTVALLMLVQHQGCSIPWPVPPIPPAPPAPTSPLVKSLQAAYDADTDPSKAANLPALAATMETVIKVAHDSGSVTTDSDLQDKIKRTTDLAVGANSMPSVRKAIGAYLVTKLPTTPGSPMTDATWATAATEYANVANALKEVKP